MAHQWDELFVELLELAPELEPDCRSEVRTALDESLRYLGDNVSPEDVAYLRDLQKSHPENMKDFVYTPGHYVVFESSLMPLLIELSSVETERGRFSHIMNWWEELANSDDAKVRDLVAIGICENLIGSEQDHAEKIVPFMGKTTRQMCLDSLPSFRLQEKTKTLFGVK